MEKHKYTTMIDPTDEQLNKAGENGWDVYWTDGTVYKLKKLM